jgi:hypothetical protein
MKIWLAVWGVLALVLAGCTATAFSPTPTWPAAAYDTAVAYHSTVITEAIQADKLNYAYVPLVSSAGCDSYAAEIEFSADQVSLAVNDTLKVTIVLRNTGCSGLGLPTYQIQPRKMAALAYASPEVQAHSLSIAPGEEDTAEFVFTAKAPGQLELVAQADFELHLDAGLSANGTPAPTPAGMWKQVLSTPIIISIK